MYGILLWLDKNIMVKYLHYIISPLFYLGIALAGRVLTVTVVAAEGRLVQVFPSVTRTV